MKKWWAVLGILGLAAGLRFWNLPANFVFGGDEEHQAVLAMTIVRDFHIIWIGVNAAHTGFFLGPYWTYLTAFWLWLSGGEVLITAYVAASIGVITTLAVWWTSKTLFGDKTGWMAGWLYATLPLIVYFDQKYWNPTVVPLLTVLIVLSLVKTQANKWWFVVAAVCSGAVFHTHLSLVPLIGVALAVGIKEKIGWRVALISTAMFVLMLAPLLVFDYYHHGSNLLTPLRFGEIQSDSTNKIDPGHHLRAMWETMGRLWYLHPNGDNGDEVLFACGTIWKKGLDPKVDLVSTQTHPYWLISLLSSTMLMAFLISKQTWKNRNSRMVALAIVLISSFFMFFPGGSYEYYLLGIFPLVVMIPGVLADRYPKLKSLLASLVIVVGILGIYTVLTNNPQFGYQDKKILVNEVAKNIGNKSFELKQSGLCHYYEGWRYLFNQASKRPLKADSDKGLGWLYSDQISNQKPDVVVRMYEKRAEDTKPMFERAGFGVEISN